MKYIKGYKMFENNDISFDFISNLNSYKNGNYSSTLIDIVNKRFGGIKFDLNDIENKFGKDFLLIFLLSSFIKLYDNGGANRWLYTSYMTSNGEPFGKGNLNINAHLKMISLLEESNLMEYIGMNTVRIMLIGIKKQYEKVIQDPTCHSCGGRGFIYGTQCDICETSGEYYRIRMSDQKEMFNIFTNRKPRLEKLLNDQSKIIVKRFKTVIKIFKKLNI